MIQHIAPYVYHNEYTPMPPRDADYVLMFRGRDILCAEGDDGCSFPTVGELSIDARAAYDSGYLVYMFRLDDLRYYLLRDEPTGQGTKWPPAYDYRNSYFLRRRRPPHTCFAGMTGLHLSTWYGNNRYCGRCGAPTALSTAERALVCTDPSCTNIIYPRISPAVIVGVTDGDRILVTRYRDRVYKGMSLVAGFCEIGEEAEQTVHREVLEETGIRVKKLRYYGSQPWGFDGNLLLGFYCEAVDPQDAHPDGDELSVAEWIARDDIDIAGSMVVDATHGVTEASVTSLTLTMIQHFKEHPEDFR